ncbi:MAG TPA: hypothetical protein VK501_10930 [Baekduia sp.]|uniref:hypothetical protein n=1 Tax=Baekduia sp. TaxID=2600305 RepID=UPI002B70CF60|nr:hypothetical protein [Baekduia sp.]HMJ34420.1 hypothetical protein [Baekduia sp.]
MDGGPVDFALTRFEATAGLLEVEGTWSGVRGMRFVRPALVVQTPSGERTLLAVLEHKPWPAEDGRPWRAAFPWTGGALDPADAELAVAPSIVVPLGEPDPDAVVDPQVALRRRLAEAEERARRVEAEVGFLRREREEMVAPDVVQRRQAAADTEHAAAQASVAQQRDAAVAARQAAIDERDQARAERDAARAERDAATAERDAARAELGERERVAAELESARDALRTTEAERDDALARPAGMVRKGARPEREHAAVATRADWAARTAAIVAVLVLLVLAISLLKAF